MGFFRHPSMQVLACSRSKAFFVYSFNFLPRLFFVQAYDVTYSLIRNVLGAQVMPKGKNIEQLAVKFAGASVERSRALLHQYQVTRYAAAVCGARGGGVATIHTHLGRFLN